MNKSNARAAAVMVAKEFRKCKGSMAGTSYTASMMVNVLISAGISVQVVRERTGEDCYKTIAVIVDGEREEV